MIEPAQPLQLDKRASLPDHIAFLRAQHPRDGWRLHTNYGDLASFWLQVHAGLRQEGSEILRIVDAFRNRRVAAADFQHSFISGMNNFLQHLDQHHRIEDKAYFPKFRQLDNHLVVGFDLLEADHVLIHQRLVGTVEHARRLLNALKSSDEVMRRAADAFAAAADDLLGLLLRHLFDEEDLVIPAMLKHGERPLL